MLPKYFDIYAKHIQRNVANLSFLYIMRIIQCRWWPKKDIMKKDLSLKKSLVSQNVIKFGVPHKTYIDSHSTNILK